MKKFLTAVIATVAMFFGVTSVKSAPPTAYAIWVYQDHPEYTYVLRNYKYNKKEKVYYAEFTVRNEDTGAVYGQEAFYTDGTYPWEPNQWPDGVWSNAPSRFHTVGTPDVGAGAVVEFTNTLPEWAENLPDAYEW